MTGLWSLSNDHGIHGNLIINPGWLAPHQSHEIYIQKFDEAFFRGPRVVEKTDAIGQLMISLPTLVEGDRVLIINDEHDLVIPCIPEFTGFDGMPGEPYVPVTIGPPLVPSTGPVSTPWPDVPSYPEEEIVMSNF